MKISTKKGDTGYTTTLGGERIPKFHLIAEAMGAIDEANSFLGLARASTEMGRIKRIIFLIQKRLFIVGAELSVPKGQGKPPKNIITETDVKWVEKLIEDLEEALSLPPGFVAFGQEKNSSQLDLVRTNIRKAERIIAKLNSKDLLANEYLLKYMNRLSDLIFLLACLEEKSAEEKRTVNKKLFRSLLAEPRTRYLAITSGTIILTLISTIVLLLIFHRAEPDIPPVPLQKHQAEMNKMHNGQR